MPRIQAQAQGVIKSDVAGPDDGHPPPSVGGDFRPVKIYPRTTRRVHLVKQRERFRFGPGSDDDPGGRETSVIGRDREGPVGGRVVEGEDLFLPSVDGPVFDAEAIELG